MMNKKKFKNLRYKILLEAKKYVENNGWNKDLFEELSKTSVFHYSEILSTFPNGYLSVIDLYLEEISIKMNTEVAKKNIADLKVHEKIKEILVIRLKVISKEKNLISKTYFHLLLPSNLKFSLKCLYKTVDQIWYLAEDKSTDFNYYSKRIILGSIYTSLITNFINTGNIEETIKLLDKQLLRVSQIPKVKDKIKNIKLNMPFFLKIFQKTV